MTMLSDKTLAVLTGGTQGDFMLDQDVQSRSTRLLADLSPDGEFCRIEGTGDIATANARKIALVNALADVAVKAAEERAAYHAVKLANWNSDEAYIETIKRHDAAKDALDASLAALEAEARKHG